MCRLRSAKPASAHLVTTTHYQAIFQYHYSIKGRGFARTKCMCLRRKCCKLMTKPSLKRTKTHKNDALEQAPSQRMGRGVRRGGEDGSPRPRWGRAMTARGGLRNKRAMPPPRRGKKLPTHGCATGGEGSGIGNLRRAPGGGEAERTEGQMPRLGRFFRAAVRYSARPPPRSHR